jgi:hypothetical protein
LWRGREEAAATKRESCWGERTGLTDMGGVQFFEREVNVRVHCGVSKAATDMEQDKNLDFMDEM